MPLSEGDIVYKGQFPAKVVKVERGKVKFAYFGYQGNTKAVFPKHVSAVHIGDTFDGETPPGFQEARAELIASDRTWGSLLGRAALPRGVKRSQEARNELRANESSSTTPRTAVSRATTNKTRRQGQRQSVRSGGALPTRELRTRRTTSTSSPQVQNGNSRAGRVAAFRREHRSGLTHQRPSRAGASVPQQPPIRWVISSSGARLPTRRISTRLNESASSSMAPPPDLCTGCLVFPVDGCGDPSARRVLPHRERRPPKRFRTDEETSTPTDNNVRRYCCPTCGMVRVFHLFQPNTSFNNALVVRLGGELVYANPSQEVSQELETNNAPVVDSSTTTTFTTEASSTSSTPTEPAPVHQPVPVAVTRTSARIGNRRTNGSSSANAIQNRGIQRVNFGIRRRLPLQPLPLENGREARHLAGTVRNNILQARIGAFEAMRRRMTQRIRDAARSMNDQAQNQSLRSSRRITRSGARQSETEEQHHPEGGGN